MMISSNYPSIFAKKLARKVGLYDVESNLEYRITIGDWQDDEMDQHKALAEFQQMSIAASFESALLAYHGSELTDEQIEALKVIHKSTAPWLLGHVVGQVTEKLNSSNDRDFVDAAEMIIENLIKENSQGNGLSESSARKLIVKVRHNE